MKDFIFVDNTYINKNDIIAIENDINFTNIYCTNNILQIDNKNPISEILVDSNFFPLRHDFFININFVSSIKITDIDEYTKQVDIRYISDYNAPKLIRTTSLSI